MGDGVHADKTVEGMLEYLRLLRRYVAIFASHQDNIITRVRSAGYVVSLLRLWRQWVAHQGGLALDKHFISREAFVDFKLSCHAFVLAVMLQRDQAHEHPMIPSRMGSNVVEDLFSELGGMYMNKRVFTMLAATETLTTKLKIAAIKSLSGIRGERHNNKRLVEQWDDVPSEGESMGDLSTFPTNEELENAWAQGTNEGRAQATTMGMAPDEPHPEW